MFLFIWFIARFFLFYLFFFWEKFLFPFEHLIILLFTSLLNYVSYVPRAQHSLVLYVPRAPHTFVFYMPRALRTLMPYVVSCLVPYMLSCPTCFVPYVFLCLTCLVPYVLSCPTCSQIDTKYSYTLLRLIKLIKLNQKFNI